MGISYGGAMGISQTWQAYKRGFYSNWGDFGMKEEPMTAERVISLTITLLTARLSIISGKFSYSEHIMVD